MPEIIPRWEWRTFGSRFGLAETRFAVLPATGVQESDEIYLVGGSGDNVKIRDGLMDIKVLREVGADGLERWEPVMKAGFPLPAADVGRVFEALRLEPPSLARDAYTLEQFIAELVEPSGILRAVDVHKRRVRYSVNGCTSEVSDVTVDGRPSRTIAIESEDRVAVVAAVRSVALDGFRNVSYPVGLGMVLDGAPERYAVIDVGTNSIKFHVAERAGGGLRAYADRAEITRMGEGLEATGEIGDEAIDRTVEAIGGMVAEAQAAGVLATVAAGTAWMRLASNADAVAAAIRDRTGVSVEPISGEEEGRLAYLAVQAGLDLGDGSLVVFDTGGGSTQFTFGAGTSVVERFSVDVGAVRYTERFGLDGAVGPDTLVEAMAAIGADLARIDGRPTPDALVGMGGAITNLTAVKLGLARYDPGVVQGSVLDRTEIDDQIDRYRNLDADGRRGIVGLQPKRADVILAGACIVRTVMDKLGQNALTVSDHGLRHGIAVERFGG
jgi:exopolyphosphatase/guanosine-5'-triphosphate,3'-diphosphate pyrophosphatase